MIAFPCKNQGKNTVSKLGVSTKAKKNISALKKIMVGRWNFTFLQPSCASTEYGNQFGIYQLSHRQNNLSNPEPFSEPCQTSKMECFAKIVNG